MTRGVPLAETLEQRLAFDLKLTGGSMPLVVVVADEEEAQRARTWLHGRRGARLLTIETRAENDAKHEALRRPAECPGGH
jgi:hypothetical protein